MVYFQKTYPAPSSLESCTSYNHQDVLDLLYDDFHNKCYICESEGIESINIEHFAPHTNSNEIRKYNWSNLFWACSHCNKIKSATESLLNCTCKDDKVDTNIKYYLDDDLENNKIIIKNIATDVKTINTADLLIKVYNGTTNQNKFQARAKRDKLYDELCDFTSILSKYQRTEDPKKKKQFLNAIKFELSNQSAFTAFKRWIVRDNKYFSNEFEQYIQDQ